MKIGKLLFILIFQMFFVMKAESQTNYTPILDFSPPPDSIKQYSKIYSKIADQTELDDRSKKKEFKKLLLESSANLFDEDTSGRLMQGDEITNFLNEILQNIQKNNPEIQNKKIIIYTLREAEPNAANEGPGVITFNLGLLERVRNIDELAFILCHEIAHEYFQHVIKGIEKYCQLYYDPEFQKKKKKILKQPYNKKKDYEKLFLSMLSNDMEHSREYELEADSMAIKFMYESGYNTKNGLTAMNLLDSSDYFLFHDSLLLQNIFNYPDFPFKDQWLKKDGTDTYWTRLNSMYEIPDSLKTHPDCKIRYQKIEQLMNNNKWHSEKQQEDISKIKYVASMELIAQLMNEEYYSFALYCALNFYKSDSTNMYINNTIALCLYELSSSIKNHTFSEYTDFPDQDFPVGYNTLLQFLHNMNSKNLRTIFDHFYHDKISTLPENYFTGYLNAIVNFESLEYKNQKKLAESYREKYPQYPDYYKKLKYKFQKK